MKSFSPGYRKSLETGEIVGYYVDITSVPWQYVTVDKFVSKTHKFWHKITSRSHDWEVRWDLKYYFRTERVTIEISKDEYDKLREL